MLAAAGCCLGPALRDDPASITLADFDAGERPPWTEIRDDCFQPTAGGARAAFAPAPGGGRALRVDFDLGSPAAGTIGLGIDLGNLNLSPYDHLRLRLRRVAPAANAPPLEAGFRAANAVRPGLEPIGSARIDGVTAEWKELTIPLAHMTGLRDWTRIDAFFIAVRALEGRSSRAAYEIDDVRVLRIGPAAAARTAATTKKKAWEESAGGREKVKRLLRTRLRGWPARLLSDRSELPRGERAFLARVARDTWRGIDALTDREHGLPLDHVRFRRGSVAVEDAVIGDYTSATNVGLYLMAVVAARELGFLSPAAALERLQATLGTIETIETSHGFAFNYYDTVTLERGSDFVSFLDSSWLTAGLIVARNAVPEIAARCAALIEREDYGRFYDESAGLMVHGWDAERGLASQYHYGLLYTEARIGSLIAIGKGDVPESHWFRMARTLPPACRWQSLPPIGRGAKQVNGHRVAGGWYEWAGERYVPSWGGSMFEALMPRLVLDERAYAAASLGANGDAHTRVQQRWAASQGYPAWGMSPSWRPAGGYGEHGVAVLGVLGYPSGVVTPHAAALALSASPAAAVESLRRLAERFDVYGDFGFYDAVDPVRGDVSHAYLSLDQSMILIAIANHLRGGCMRGFFAADAITQRVLPLLGAERFFE